MQPQQQQTMLKIEITRMTIPKELSVPPPMRTKKPPPRLFASVTSIKSVKRETIERQIELIFISVYFYVVFNYNV